MCANEGYARRRGEDSVDSGFVRYEPVTLPRPKPDVAGKTAEEKRRFMHARIRLRQLSEERSAKHKRRVLRDIEVGELIASFVSDGSEAEAKVSVDATKDADDGTEAEFWKELIPGSATSRLAHIEDPDLKPFRIKQCKPTRISRLKLSGGD